MKKPIYVALALIASSGCSTNSADHSTQARANAPIVCSGDDQCGKLWDAAQVWLAQHSEFKIQSASNSVIQTYGPKRNSPALAYVVIKEPGQYATHTIKISAACDNIFGCQPNATSAIADFKDYLLTLP